MLIYILSGKKSKKNKRKKSTFMRKFSGIATAVCFICTAVFGILYCKGENITLFNRLTSYELPTAYTSALATEGADKAYSLLPVGVYTQNGNIYFINSKNDSFILKKTEDGSSAFITDANDTIYIGGEKTLKAVIKSSGELILDGYFLYSKYDEEYLEYSNTIIAKNVKYVSSTDNSLFYITNDGDLYAMGFNEYGQLCDTTTKNKPSPVFIMGNVQSADISDTHAMIIDKYGTLYAAGGNSYSQLGNKNAISTTEITKVMQGIRDAKVGNYFSLVLTFNGELYSAGTNEKGQLGNNGEEFKAELIPVMTGVDKISVIGNTCAALTYDGQLYVWGDNKDHKAGSDEGDVLASPVKIQENVYDFALNTNGIVVLTRNRDIFCSDRDGKFISLIEFSAEIPDQYKERNAVYDPDMPEKV